MYLHSFLCAGLSVSNICPAKIFSMSQTLSQWLSSYIYLVSGFQCKAFQINAGSSSDLKIWILNHKDIVICANWRISSKMGSMMYQTGRKVPLHILICKWPKMWFASWLQRIPWHTYVLSKFSICRSNPPGCLYQILLPMLNRYLFTFLW